MQIATKTRQEQRALAARESILDAAEAVFARSGLKAATMRDIAEHAGYTAPALYNYFASRDEIVEALFARVGSELLAVFDRPTAKGLSLSQRLEGLLQGQLEVMGRRSATFGLLSTGQASASRGEEVAAQQIGMFREYIARLTAWFRAHTTVAERGRRAPDECAYLLWGVASAFHARVMFGASPDAPPDHGALVTAAPAIAGAFLFGVAGRGPRGGRRRAAEASRRKAMRESR